MPPARGLWSIPGGKLEPGESLIDACKREIKEETGLDAEIKNIVAVVERRIENFHYVIIDYLAVLAERENVAPIARTDVSEAQWIPLEDLAAYERVDGLLEIILRTYRVYSSEQLAGLYDVKATGTDSIIPAINRTESALIQLSAKCLP